MPTHPQAWPEWEPARSFLPILLPISAGVEYAWNENLTLRAGLSYEWSALSDRIRQLLIADNDLLKLQVHALSAADVPEIGEAVRRSGWRRGSMPA